MCSHLVGGMTHGLLHGTQVDVTSEQARRAYEARWQQFQSKTRAGKPGIRLAYIDIPWPAEEFASNDELIQVLFACTLV